MRNESDEELQMLVDEFINNWSKENPTLDKDFYWLGVNDGVYLLIKHQESKPERILDAPAKHNLNVIFQELKFGRPVESQEFLDKCIKVLESGEMLNHVSVAPQKEETFMDRLIKERDELHDKFEKLTSFLSKEEKAKEISGIRQFTMLSTQWGYMGQYLATLNQRIENLNQA